MQRPPTHGIIKPKNMSTPSNQVSCSASSNKITTNTEKIRTPYKLSSQVPEDAEPHALDNLVKQGFPTGLAQSLLSTHDLSPLRIWVIDNSGSMKIRDGHLMHASATNHTLQVRDSTRWEEIKECIFYHMHLATLLKLPSMFRLLNDNDPYPSKFNVAVNCTSEEDIIEDMSNSVKILRAVKPCGNTPLIPILIEIRQFVTEIVADLIDQNKRITVIITSDGLPTNKDGKTTDSICEDFQEQLRLLHSLPVHVIIRLCTDDKDVIDFYHQLDKNDVQNTIDIVDDYFTEAEQIFASNPWLNYALPLHRCREMGIHTLIFDVFDERLLTIEELRTFCTLLFGESKMKRVTDPKINWKSFLQGLKLLLKEERLQWHPIKKKMDPWINLRVLNANYGPSESECNIM